MIDVRDFLEAGYLPEALLNYLALLGWNPGDDREVLSLDEMIEAFSLDRVNKTSGRFNPQKLEWLNGEYMKSLPMERLEQLHDTYLEAAPHSPCASLPPARRRALLEMYRARASTFSDLDNQAAFFFSAPTSWVPKVVKKHLLKGDGLDRLQAARGVLQSAEWSIEGIDAALQAGAEAGYEGRVGKLAQPVRVAITGTGVSPGISETLAMLTKEDVLARIDACVAATAP